MIIATAIGRVMLPGKIVAPEGRSQFCSVIIESQKEWGGKVYSQSVDVIVYGRDIANLAPRLTKGVLVCATGECSLSKSKDGKYTNLKIMGNVQILDAPTRPADPRPAPTPAKPEPVEPEDEDRIPF